jgi:DNA-binding phage protein
MYRSGNYNKMISEDLQNDPTFAREYILVTMNEDKLSLIDSLKQMIEKMGISEFAKLTGFQRSNISRFVSTNEFPQINTLNKYLAPFNLKVKIDVEKVVA